MHKLIAEMIAVNCQPISIVEDIGFQRLIGKVKPNYVIPSRKYFSQKFIPDIFRVIKGKIQKIVTDADNLSLATDLWTSSSNDCFMSLTCHSISNEFDKHTSVLSIKPFPEKRSAINISETIHEIVNEYNIPHYKINLISYDNAAIVTKEIADSQYSSIPCFLHMLQQCN